MTAAPPVPPGQTTLTETDMDSGLTAAREQEAL